MRLDAIAANVIQAPKLELQIMRYELSDYEWTAIKPMLPNKPRGVRRVNDRRVLNGGIVPLICPTCQNVFAGSLKASMPATTMLLCMGLFSIF
jgi:hypothetical protein